MGKLGREIPAGEVFGPLGQARAKTVESEYHAAFYCLATRLDILKASGWTMRDIRDVSKWEWDRHQVVGRWPLHVTRATVLQSIDRFNDRKGAA